MDRSRVDRLLNAEDPQEAIERGVSYEFLERLMIKQRLSNMTTRQVVKQYVVPQTFNSKCSLSGLLRQVQPQSVGRATHYVVHPWDGNFERLVRALGAVDGSHDDEEGNPPYFWIDVFALNQRQQVEGYKREEDAWLHRDEMFSQIRDCIRSVEKICVIVDPVTHPIVIKRAWCLFECAEALSLGKEMILCPVPEPPDQDPFLDVVYDFEKTLENYIIDFVKQETTIPIDKGWLEAEVLSLNPLGAKWVNERVSQEFLGWLGDRAAGRVLATNFLASRRNTSSSFQGIDNSNSNSNNEPNPSSPPPVLLELGEEADLEYASQEEVGKRLILMQRLSRLLSDFDRGNQAREIIEHAGNRATQIWGPEDERTLSIRHDLACLIAKSFGELRKAAEILRQVLSLRQKKLGDEHESVLETTEALGRVLKERRKLTEAISLFRHVIAVREKNLGPTHYQTLVTLNLLALTLQKREHYKEAEKVFRRVVYTGKDTLGATNTEVLVWSNNLAVLYQDTKQWDKAEILLRSTLRNAEHALGPTHYHTLTLVFNLGYCLWHQGRVRAAEGFFRRELAGCEATKGPEHRDTLRSRQNLFRLIKSQKGREEEAEMIIRGSKPKEEYSSGSSSPTMDNHNMQRHIKISSPEVPPQSPTKHGHLLAVSAGLSALPPPRGVTGPRKLSTEWNTSPSSLPRDVENGSGGETPEQNRTSPVSVTTTDGDDRTADDTTGSRSEERSFGGVTDEEDQQTSPKHHIFDDIDESEIIVRREGAGSKETFSDEEEVVQYDEGSFSADMDENHGRGGRARREQTVTSDDEFLASNLAGDEEDDEDNDDDEVERYNEDLDDDSGEEEIDGEDEDLVDELDEEDLVDEEDDLVDEVDEFAEEEDDIEGHSV